ncbi:MAG: hypothetical protein U0271_10745 [Polyangiaceae bacterium]
MSAHDDESIDALLDRARAATEELDAREALTGAVMRRISDISVTEAAAGSDPDALFARAAAATHSIEPTAALTDAVMARLAVEPVRRATGSVMDGVVRAGPVAVVAALAAVAASMWFFVESERSFDVSVVSALDTMELSE